MAKKQPNKIRVAFRKNRANIARQNDITRAVHSESHGVDGQDRSQRVSGRGNLTRRRTILGARLEGDQIVLDVDEAKCRRGRVLAAIGATQCTVQEDPDQPEAGRRYECTVRGVVRTVARDARNAVVTGDRVLFLPTEEGQGVIERVEPRQGVLARGHQYKQHILVANITQSAIIVSAIDPPLKPALIDRFLVSAAKGRVEPMIVLNKVDLVDLADLQPIIGLYARLGYRVVPTSICTGQGVAELRRRLKGQQTVFTGQSGVGKSSLLNTLQPGLHLRTADVSRATQKGRPLIAGDLKKGYQAQAVNPIFPMQKLMDQFLRPATDLLLVLTILIIIVSGIGIFVSIYNSMAARRREIAIMRALGAQRLTVFAIILAESIILCVGGGVFGLIFGHGLVFAAAPLVESYTGLIVNPRAFDPQELILFPALLVLAALVGILPGLTAYRTDVAESLSGN